MPFNLSNEKAINTLIWWVEGADGSIEYEEEEAVKQVLEHMDYSMQTYRETLSHIGSLSNERIDELVEKSISWGSKRFSEDKKQAVILLLHHVAACNGDITKEQHKKLERVKQAFNN